MTTTISASALEAILDPHERADAASRALKTLEEEADRVRSIRDLAFNELYHSEGVSLRGIATRYGVSKSLVADVTR